MGVPAGDPVMSAARRWLRAQPDSVTVLPSWGRMWLAMLGLYEYEGINPLVPKTVLLPGWVPVHPDRLYVHTRMIYFGLSCLYAERARFDLGLVTGELRGELFVRPSALVRLGADLLARYERHPVRVLRAAAVRRCLARLTAELEASAGHVPGQRAAGLPGPGPVPARRARPSCRRSTAWTRGGGRTRTAAFASLVPAPRPGILPLPCARCCARPTRRRSVPRSAVATGGWPGSRPPRSCRSGCGRAVTRSWGDGRFQTARTGGRSQTARPRLCPRC